MELRRLRNFLAVGEALNFTKAARQLRVGQPALSRQVQDLEDEIGVDLLRRSPRDATLELAITVEPDREQAAGLEFEVLRSYPVCVAMAATHPLAHLKSIPLKKLSAEPLVGLRRNDYPEYYRNLSRIFAPLGVKPR